jgi:hypothetical protein
MFDVRHGDDRGPAAMDADKPAVVRAQIGDLERRLDDMANGLVTPRQVKDEMLWLCSMCQRSGGDSGS